MGEGFLGSGAGTVVADNVVDFAHERGFYVIIQSATGRIRRKKW